MTVTLTHPKLSAEIEVPETAVKHYERSGWTRQQDKPKGRTKATDKPLEAPEDEQHAE